MPLIDHSQLKQHNQGVDDVIKVVVAILILPEGTVHKVSVTTVQRFNFLLSMASVLDQTFEGFHSHDGKYIIKHLQ